MSRYKKKATRKPDEQVDKAALEKRTTKISHKPSFARAEYAVQKFSSPSWRQVLSLGVLSTLLASTAGFGGGFALSPEVVILVALAIALFIVLLVTAMTAQRLEIAGSIVKISNTASFYRYRQFDVSEVSNVRLLLPQGKSSIITFRINLKRSPNRKWNQISLAKFMGLNTMTSINCDIYIALVEAIRRQQPGFTVQDLPYGYSGPLGESAYG